MRAAVPIIRHAIQPLPRAHEKAIFLLFMPNTQVILIGFPVSCPFSINKFLIIFLCYVDFVCPPTPTQPHTSIYAGIVSGIVYDISLCCERHWQK